MASSKIIIYQVFTRLYGNKNTTRKEDGTLAENGCGKLNDFTPTALKKIRTMGVSHIWYTGVIRHATQTDYSAYGIPRQHPAVVKGKAGSPYAITDYYDIDPDLAVDVPNRMAEFEALIDRSHKAGLKVIIDFVPNHVARQYHSICAPEGVKDLGEEDNQQNGFDPQNNFYYCPGQRFTPYLDLYHGEAEPYIEEPAKATGNDCFHNAPGMNDWYETVKLNYGLDYYAGRIGHFNPIPNTWDKMTEILLFWAAKGVDGFRCDMAEMVPAAFWHWATDKVKFRYPEMLFIGEVYNPAEYRNYIGAGFDWLYDKVGMYDCVRDVICGNRRAADITSQWQHTDDIRQHMLYFLENHDEQRIASDFFAADARKGIPGLIVSALLNTSPFMLYAGQEFGERGMDKEGFSGCDGRTTIFDYWCVETLRRGYFDRRKMKKEERELESIYQRILTLVNKEKALSEGLSYDLMYVNQHIADRQFAFLRKHENETLLIVANFDDRDIECDVVIPRHAFEYLQMAEGTYNAIELLTGEATTLTLAADNAAHVSVPALSGVVIKVS